MTIRINKSARAKLMGTACASTVAFMLMTMPAAAVVPNDNQTPEDIVDDEVNVTGVGMFFRNDGFVCSGSLINPRTVLFAAHCVNDRPMNDYGPVIQSAWSFQTDALPGFIDWISAFQSNPDLYVYNVNQIIYNLDSIARPDSQGFLEGDVALSSLDTPAGNIPTWALLFSPLPAPDAIDPVTGTGYHVNIVGYGRTGSGTGGANVGIDWRRRAAENMLGALTSFDERNTFLFGNPFGDLPSSLYRLDFDDPNQANPFDFNLYRDEPLAREGTTAGGDSGGPLILDAANNPGYEEDLVLGVLSGGSRFFGGQVFSSYGTESFYQPLFLYWDWIAANNPYRYVGANAGDGNWEDASHWTSLMDPAYRIIDPTGAVINGIPTNPGAGINGDEPDFGQVCFDPHPRESGAGDACQDLSDGTVVSFPADSTPGLQSGIGQVGTDLFGVDPSGPTADFEDVITVALTPDGAQAQSGIGTAQIGGLDIANLENAPQDAGSPLNVDDLENQPQAGGFLDTPLPDPTLDNGLPGATDFVPNNIDPDVLAGINARYFDVTLSQSGTTTLSSMVEIDRLAVMGGAGLNIASTGDLTSLIDIMQTSGTINVDGNLSTLGDYLLVGGLLSGSGTINTPFLTNIAGGIAPGGMGGIGQLDVNGSVVMSSGSVLMIDVAGGSNDVLNITGDVSLGGSVGIGGTFGWGDTFTILNYGGTASNAFDGPAIAGNGVLRGIFTDTGSGIDVTIDATSFSQVLGASATGTQLSYGQALDQARLSNFAGMQDVFSSVDFMDGLALADAFDDFAPNDAVVGGQSLIASGDALKVRLDSRLQDLRRGERGFQVQGSSAGLELAAAMPNNLNSTSQFAAMNAGDESTTYSMSEGMGGFANIDFFNADSESGLMDAGADIDGYALTAGLDRTFDNGLVIGAMLSYSTADASLRSATDESETSGGSVGLYGFVPLANEMFIDGHVSYGNYSVDTSRSATLSGTTLNASGDTDADLLLAGAAFGRAYQLGNGTVLTPSLGIQHANYDIDGYTETGSSIALNVDERELTSTQISLGTTVDWEMGESGVFKPMIGAAIVHDVDGGRDFVLGQFAAAPTAAPIALIGPERSKTWFDVEAGLDMNISERVIGSFSVSHSINRDDLEQTVLGGSLQIKF